MDFGAKPIATAVGATQASILAEQMAHLKEQRSRMNEENAAYLQKHPELKTLLDEFMIAALTAKPADLVKFAAIFFTQMKDPNVIKGWFSARELFSLKLSCLYFIRRPNASDYFRL